MHVLNVEINKNNVQYFRTEIFIFSFYMTQTISALLPVELVAWVWGTAVEEMREDQTGNETEPTQKTKRCGEVTVEVRVKEWETERGTGHNVCDGDRGRESCVHWKDTFILYIMLLQLSIEAECVYEASSFHQISLHKKMSGMSIITSDWIFSFFSLNSSLKISVINIRYLQIPALFDQFICFTFYQFLISSLITVYAYM